MFVWKIIPFMTIDVLYLIAVSIPVLVFLRKQRAKTFAALTLLFFFIAPLLQKAAGYSPSVHEYSFINYPGLLPLIKRASHHWLVDGWFPFFPWLGFCFLGAFAGKLRLEKSQPDLLKLVNIAGPCLLLLGVVLWTLSPRPLLTREGYSELFYPPTLGYLLTASGVIFTLYGMVQKTAAWRGYDGFKILGRAALFVYLFHQVFIEYVLLPVVKQPQPLIQFLGLYFLTASLAFMAALILNNIRPKTGKLPYLFRMFTGS